MSLNSSQTPVPVVTPAQRTQVEILHAHSLGGGLTCPDSLALAVSPSLSSKRAYMSRRTQWPGGADRHKQVVSRSSRSFSYTELVRDFDGRESETTCTRIGFHSLRESTALVIARVWLALSSTSKHKGSFLLYGSATGRTSHAIQADTVRIPFLPAKATFFRKTRTRLPTASQRRTVPYRLSARLLTSCRA